MNLRDLRYLVAAADTEHFGRAAEQCQVSQPTLSGQIRKLEDTLGVGLFERSHRSVVLTDVGHEIAARARDILGAVRRMESLAQSRRDPLVGELRVGIIPTLCAYLLPHLLPAWQQQFANLQPVIVEDKTADLLAQLNRHEIDVAVLATDHLTDNFVSQPLFPEQLWVAVSHQHPLARRVSIEGAELESSTLLTLAGGHCLAEQVREIAPRLETNANRPDLTATSLETLLQLVAADYGVTFVPALAVNHARDNYNVAFLPVSTPDSYRQIRLIYRRSSSRQAALRQLAALISDKVPSSAVDYQAA